MIRKVWLLLAILVASNNHGKICTSVNPDSIVFAFDLHNVVVKPDIIQMLKVAFQELHKISLYMLLNPRIWYNIITYEAVPEKLVDRLSIKYADQGITKEFLIKLINNQVLDHQMVMLINQLRRQGYKVYLASNIWESMLKDLLLKIPELNELFDGYFVPSKSNDHIQKPDKKYYQGLKKYLGKNGQTGKKIIFIDNEEENIKQAKETGLFSIKFIDEKQLRGKLKQLGFKLK